MKLKSFNLLFVMSIVATFVFPGHAFSQDFTKLSGEYFGQAPPGKTPVVFAPGIVCTKDRFAQDIAISPDGKEICFVASNNKWNAFKTFYTRQNKQGFWSNPVKAPFLKDKVDGFRCYFSPDGGKIYFISVWPRNVYMSARKGDDWSDPVKLDMPVSSEKMENSVSHSADNRLFFCSHREGGKGGCDVYYSKIEKGAYAAAKNIAVSNTGYNDCGPVLSPDGGYLLFHSNRPGGFGGADLYVCFNQGKDKWSKPINMGPKINTDSFEVIAHISPKGKYIFFTRRKAPSTDEPSKVYWVDASIISNLKPGPK